MKPKPFPCPRCGSPTRTLGSAQFVEDSVGNPCRRRNYACNSCEHAFATVEFSVEPGIPTKSLVLRSRIRRTAEPVLTGGRSRYSPHRAKILEMRKAGVTLRQMASELGISISTVQYHIRGLKAEGAIE